MTQGGQANKSGNLLENTLKSICIQNHFQVAAYKDWLKAPLSFGRELLLTRVPYRSVYGHNGNTEFLLKSEKYGLETRIECKWQQVSGSVDEKLPYLYLNCIEAVPESHMIIIIDGGGWKSGAIEWLQNAAKQKRYTTEANRHKKIEVMRLSDFLTWSNATFR